MITDTNVVAHRETTPARADAQPVGDESTAESKRWQPSVWVLGLLLAFLAMNVSTARPVYGIYSSFVVGMGRATSDGFQYGVDIAWPYGPLGFVAGPTILDRGLLAVAIAFQVAVLTLLFATLLALADQRGLRRRFAVALLVPTALAFGITEIVAEALAVSVVVILVGLWQLDLRRGPSPTSWWVLLVSGVTAGALVLVKVGPGTLACAVVVWFAVSSAARLRLVPLAVGAVLGGFFFAWIATGGSLSTLDDYIRTARELSSGYQDGQAVGPVGGRSLVLGLATIGAAAVVAVGIYWWVRRAPRALWAVVPLVAAMWFELKQGFVRWDVWHAAGALLPIGLLGIAVPWPRRYALAPVCVLVVAVLGAFAVEPSRLRDMMPDRADVALALLSGGQQQDQIASARRDLQASYDVPAPVIDALAGATVHAEPWDINAVWGYGLEWEPLPVLQSYSAYTAELDRMNAEHYSSDDGPGGVLFSPLTVDYRYGPWESPAARVALTCNFAAVVTSGDWSALRRAPDVCGAPRELSTVVAAAGSAIDIPQPSDPNSLVVAYFDLPNDLLNTVLTTVARPVHYAEVSIDGTDYRLVLGTAENAHLVGSPGVVGDRELPHGRMDLHTLAFHNIGSGDVVVRFMEIPLDAS